MTLNEGDANGRKMRVQVVNNGVVENLTGAGLNLAWVGRLGKGLDNFTAVDATKGIFEITFKTGMLNNTGSINASLQLILPSGSGIVESTPFPMDNRPSLVDGDSAQSTDSWTALENALANAENLEAQYTPKLFSLEAQLQHTSDTAHMVAEGQDLHGSPIAKPLKVKVLAPLDEKFTNYAGSPVFESGSVAENPPVKALLPLNGGIENLVEMTSPVANATPVIYGQTPFGKGVQFDTTQALTYTLPTVASQIRSGGISLHFKPIKNLQNGDNIEYNLMHLYNGESRIMQVKLNYLTADNILGLHILLANGSDTFVATIPNVNFTSGKDYSVALTWEWDGSSPYASLTIYLNGVFNKTVTFNPNCLPPGLTKIIVGNAPAFNRPAQAILHNVLVTTRQLTSEDFVRLQNAPIDTTAAYFADVYSSGKKGKFYEGRAIQNNKRLTAPIARAKGDILEGSASVRITPLQDIKQGINQKKRVFSVVSDLLGDILTVDLDYLTTNNIHGLAVAMSNGTITRLSNSPGLTFVQGQSYTIGVEWKIDTTMDEGYLATYLNGQIIRVTNISRDIKPSNIYQLRAGNNDLLNQPIDSIVEGLFYADEAIGTYGHKKLHHEPLHLSAISDGGGYKTEFESVGYSGAKHSHIVLNQIEGRLFGVQDTRFGVMKVSDDEGKTWKDYYNFGSTFGLGNPRIDFIEKFNGYEFVGIRDATTGMAQMVRGSVNGYQNVLTFTQGRYMVNDWSWTTYQNTIVVTEYGQNANVPARAFKSTDNGTSWTVIYTTPAGTNHIHSAKFDPYTGWLYLSYGDNVTELLRSKDRGVTWERLDNDLSNKVISMAFKPDAVYMACDYYGGTSLLRVWDKQDERMFRLSPQVKFHNVHTYAIYFDKAGYLWWYSFADGGSTMTDRHSSFYISSNRGLSEIRLDDMGRSVVSYPYRFVETANYMWFGNYKMTKPVIKKVS